MKTKIIFGIALVAFLIFAGIRLTTPSQPTTLHGGRIEPSPRAADFTLTAQDGKPYRLSEQTGKTILLYFGYTTCPDVCPTTLAQLRQVRAQLKQQADHVRVVFVTIDPERDTPDKLRIYMGNFDPTFIGLSGSVAELDPVWRAYGVYRAKVNSESALGYLMDHSAYVYVIDARGNLRETFSFGETTDNMFADVKFLLGDAASSH